MKMLHMVAFTLLLIGGLNWLMVGVFGWGIGQYLGDTASRAVYVLVGLAAVAEIVTHKGTCKMCGSSSMGGMA